MPADAETWNPDEIGRGLAAGKQALGANNFQKYAQVEESKRQKMADTAARLAVSCKQKRTRRH